MEHFVREQVFISPRFDGGEAIKWLTLVFNESGNPEAVFLSAYAFSQNGVVRREGRWSTAGASPARELDRSTR
jgi:hypothetical protein